MSDLSVHRNIESALSRVESGEASADEALTLINNAQAFARAAKELKSKADAALIEWIEKNGELNDGQTRWYVGRDKYTKVIDKAQTLKALVEATGGDIESIAQYLTSEPFKHGACGGVIDRNEHFTTEIRKCLDTGKPVKKLASSREDY